MTSGGTFSHAAKRGFTERQERRSGPSAFGHPTGWIFICGGIFEMIYGPTLWRNYRGITNKPYRGLGSRAQQRAGMLLTLAGPLTVAMGVLLLLGRF